MSGNKNKLIAFNFGCLDHLSKNFDELTGAEHY